MRKNPAPVTLIRTGKVSSVGNAVASDALELDLGLAIGEIARIVGVYLQADIGAILGSQAYSCITVSFDPEDTVADLEDNEHFASLRHRRYTTDPDSGSIETSIRQFFDFSNLNLLTCRNLAFCGRTTPMAEHAPAFNAFCIIYYEKMAPSPQQLNELIAYRR